MKFRIVTNNKGEYSIERESVYEEIISCWFFSKPKWNKVKTWVACPDLSNQSAFCFKALGVGPHIMNLVRKKYDSLESAQKSLNEYLCKEETDEWYQVGDIREID